jgi:hypothetical protein
MLTTIPAQNVSRSAQSIFRDSERRLTEQGIDGLSQPLHGQGKQRFSHKDTLSDVLFKYMSTRERTQPRTTQLQSPAEVEHPKDAL